MENNKKKILVILLILLLVIVVPFSLALFVLYSNTESVLELELETVDNKTLIFEKGDSLSVYVDIYDFTSQQKDITASTIPSVLLTAKDNTIDLYNVYLYIYDNSINYAVNDDTPELILNVYDENGDEVTSLEDLTYVTGSDYSGFDITEASGLITIALDKEIEVDNSTIKHEWKFEVTFRYLEEVQNLNLGKSLNSQICLAQSLEECDFVGFSDVVLIQNGGASYIESKTEPDFAKAAMTLEAYDTYDEWCTDTYGYCSIDRATPNENGMYATEDADGTTYYYRGAVDNNWVVFGKEGGKDIYWRIVRVEGNGNVKMIYSGTTPPTEEDAITMESSSTQLADTSVFNTLSNSTVYTGYVYQTGVLHGTSTSSTVKGKVDTWYNTNLASDYGDYIEPSEYCVDRVTYSFNSSGGLFTYTFTKNSSQVVTTVNHFLGPYVRMFTENTSNPSLLCETESDILFFNVGLITIDEVAIAGGRMFAYNQFYYLYTNNTYWTLSPASYYSSNPGVFVIESAGMFRNLGLSNTYGVRPTISLSSSLFVSKGNGTWNNPYIIT